MSDEQILELGTGLLINTFLMLKHIHDPDFIMQNAELIFINLTEPHSQQDFIVLVLAYFYKNSQLAEEKIQSFIKNLPKTLNKTAMSTYDMILAKGIKIGIEEERQRIEEEMRQLEEESRQRVNKAILYLYQIDQKTPEEIAMIVSKDQTYVETVISNSEEENITDN
jgi:predicted MPP superfamily phosphohydrolase